VYLFLALVSGGFYRITHNPMYLGIFLMDSPEMQFNWRLFGKDDVIAEFPEDDGGKPTVMRYIIRHQAGIAESWEGE